MQQRFDFFLFINSLSIVYYVHETRGIARYSKCNINVRGYQIYFFYYVQVCLFANMVVDVLGFISYQQLSVLLLIIDLQIQTFYMQYISKAQSKFISKAQSKFIKRLFCYIIQNYIQNQLNKMSRSKYQQKQAYYDIQNEQNNQKNDRFDKNILQPIFYQHSKRLTKPNKQAVFIDQLYEGRNQSYVANQSKNYAKFQKKKNNSFGFHNKASCENDLNFSNIGNSVKNIYLSSYSNNQYSRNAINNSNFTQNLRKGQIYGQIVKVLQNQNQNLKKHNRFLQKQYKLLIKQTKLQRQKLTNISYIEAEIEIQRLKQLNEAYKSQINQLKCLLIQQIKTIKIKLNQVTFYTSTNQYSLFLNQLHNELLKKQKILNYQYKREQQQNTLFGDKIQYKKCERQQKLCQLLQLQQDCYSREQYDKRVDIKEAKQMNYNKIHRTCQSTKKHHESSTSNENNNSSWVQSPTQTTFLGNTIYNLPINSQQTLQYSKQQQRCHINQVMNRKVFYSN